jgi:hypothetical protein
VCPFVLVLIKCLYVHNVVTFFSVVIDLYFIAFDLNSYYSMTV